MQIHLGNEIGRLKKMILELCTYVEENVRLAVDAVEAVDGDKAKSVIKRDKVVDAREIDIEEECLKILALYQPVASDLRYVVACLKLNNDLERIGDMAKVIAKYALKVKQFGITEIPLNFTFLEEKTKEMLRQSIESFIESDAALAMKVCIADNEVDELEAQMKADIRDLIRQEPEKLDSYLAMIGVARSLERIADCTTNIAEDVIYLVNGEIVRHKGE